MKEASESHANFVRYGELHCVCVCVGTETRNFLFAARDTKVKRPAEMKPDNKAEHLKRNSADDDDDSQTVELSERYV